MILLIVEPKTTGFFLLSSLKQQGSSYRRALNNRILLIVEPKTTGFFLL